MPTMIAVITQDEDANLTMAPPLLDTLLVAQIPAAMVAQIPAARKMTQQTIAFKKSSNKKGSKINNSKKNKTGKAKLGAFAKMGDYYVNKSDGMDARSNHLQQLLNLARGIEN